MEIPPLRIETGMASRQALPHLTRMPMVILTPHTPTGVASLQATPQPTMMVMATPLPPIETDMARHEEHQHPHTMPMETVTPSNAATTLTPSSGLGNFKSATVTDFNNIKVRQYRTFLAFEGVRVYRGCQTKFLC